MHTTSLWRVDEPGSEWYESFDWLLRLLADREPGKYRVEKWSIVDPIDSVPTTDDILRWLADELTGCMIGNARHVVDAPAVIACVEVLRAVAAAEIDEPAPYRLADEFTVEVSETGVTVHFTSEEVQ